MLVTRDWSSLPALQLASVQTVIFPCGITAKTTEEQQQEITAKCEELVATLRKVSICARADLRGGYTPGYKFNDWEQEGVPLHLEIGPQDLAKKQTLESGTTQRSRCPSCWQMWR